MSTLTEIQPFPTIARRAVRFLEPLVDDAPPPAAEVICDLSPEFGSPSIDLSRLPNWSTLRVKVEFDADISGYGTTEAQSTLDALLVLSCSATKIRRAQLMTHAQNGKWSGEVELQRSELLDTAFIGVRLMPRVAIEVGGHVSVFEGALTAESERLEIFLDERAKPYSGPIRWRWEQFSTSDLPMLRERAATIFYVDPSDVPTVYLNSGLPNLRDILEGTERAGPTTGIRHTLESGIATAVFMELLTAAFLHFRRDDETGEFEIDASWRGALVRAAAKPLYGLSSQECLSRFHDDFQEESTRSEALSRLMSVSQQFARVDRNLSAAVRASELFNARGDNE